MSFVNLRDPRRPLPGSKSFRMDNRLQTALDSYYRRRICGIYDEGDRVYYPVRFLLLDGHYFASRLQLIVVSAIDSDERINSELGSSPVKQSKMSHLGENHKELIKAKRIFAALSDDGAEVRGRGMTKEGMTLRMKEAFQILFEFHGETNEICSPLDLAISVSKV